MAELTEKAKELVDEPNFAYLATVNSDGSPQVSPVWIDRENGTLVVNTAVGRAKERNMRREPRVALSIANRENQYEKVDIKGRVIEMDDSERAVEHIHQMAKKYMGQDEYPWLQPDEQRILVKIEPDRVIEMG